MKLMSVEYKICVRCGKHVVHISGDACSTCTVPLLLHLNCDPYGLPIMSECLSVPNLVEWVAFLLTFIGYTEFIDKYTIAVSPSCIISLTWQKLMFTVFSEMSKYDEKNCLRHFSQVPD
jgi:hypothetical protein